MFGWAMTFLVVALIAGALGLRVLAGAAFAAAKIVFAMAMVAFLIRRAQACEAPIGRLASAAPARALTPPVAPCGRRTRPC